MSEIKHKMMAAVLGLAMTQTAAAQWNTDSTEWNSYDRWRLGGYGEMVAAFKDYKTDRMRNAAFGATHENRNTIAIPRFVIAGDYKFSKHWNLGVEIEFEAGGTGTAIEIEEGENQFEYETEVEKGGEVALEQFHLTYHLNQFFNVRAGHMIVPVGLTNAHHEPVNFFGTVRPEGESTLIPNTWHETGIAFFGQFGRRWASFDWEAQVVTGLNVNGFQRKTWVADGKQGLFEVDNFTSPAYVVRLNYRGIPGLRLGASVYYCNDCTRNADASKTDNYNFAAPLVIWSVDAQYRNRWVIARANVLRGHLDNSYKVGVANTRLGKTTPYSRKTPVGEVAVSYGGEVGLRLKGFVRSPKMPDIIPFVRYEYYNPQEKVEAPEIADPRFRVSMWTAGLNYKPLPFIVVKADYTTRSIGGGDYNSENEFALGVAFTGWFFGDKASQARWAAYKAKRAAKREASEKAVIEDMNRRLEQQQKELDALKAKMM